MTYYAVLTHTIDDLESYGRDYIPGVVGLITRHRGEVLVAEPDADRLEGTPARGVVLLRFPSKQEFHAWHRDPDYRPLRATRQALTSHRAMVGGTEFGESA